MDAKYRCRASPRVANFDGRTFPPMVPQGKDSPREKIKIAILTSPQICPKSPSARIRRTMSISPEPSSPLRRHAKKHYLPILLVSEIGHPCGITGSRANLELCVTQD
jgi:hypothetical protein